MNKSKIIVTLVAFAALAGLGVVLWQPATTGLAQLWSPLPTPIPIVPTPLPTLTPYIPETPPPVPTPLPTPAVTPIPEAEPPFIPGLEDAVPQPFHIVLREGNKVWTVNSDGSDRRLLIDTEDKAGLYLGHYPVQGIEGPPLRWGSVSPDGTKLALVVTDLWEVEYKGQPYGWQICLFDIQTGEFHFLVEGREPVWSPDGTRIAYVWGSGLWVADAISGEVKELFPVEEGYWVRDMAWSPDGRRIAFLHQEASLGGSPEMLLTSVDGSESTTRLIPPTTWAMWGTAWFSSGKRILYVFPEAEPTGQHFDNLWTVNVETRTSVPLTTQVIVSSFALSPSDGDWIAFVGKLPYEAEPSPLNDLWLLRGDGSLLLCLTRDSTSDRGPQWSPDGTQIVFRRENEGLWVLNLIDGSLKQVYASSADFEVTR